MNNTLHIYGCSYSELFGDGYNDYYDLRGGNYPETWSELLAKKLSLNLNNRAKGGTCNELIFQNFCQDSDKFKSGDTIILEWSYLTRFAWIDNNDDVITSTYGGYINAIDEETSNIIAVNRTSDKYKLQLIDYQKLINDYCKLKGLTIWYWYADADMHKFIDTTDSRYLLMDSIMNGNRDWSRTTFNVVFEKGGQTIEEETNGKINDPHFGESAHKIKADLFYDHIKKYSKLV